MAAGDPCVSDKGCFVTRGGLGRPAVCPLSRLPPLPLPCLCFAVTVDKRGMPQANPGDRRTATTSMRAVLGGGGGGEGSHDAYRGCEPNPTLPRCWWVVMLACCSKSWAVGQHPPHSSHRMLGVGVGGPGGCSLNRAEAVHFGAVRRTRDDG